MSATRKPKASTKNRDAMTVAELVLDLDQRIKGGDALSDVLLPFEEWLTLVERAEVEALRHRRRGRPRSAMPPSRNRRVRQANGRAVGA